VDKADPDGYDPLAVRGIYDGMAAEYAAKHGAELSEPGSDTAFLDSALTGLPDGPVLDVGCGPAQVSGYVVARGRAAIGIDLAPGMLAAAARLVHGARLIAADLLAPPLRQGSCAAVVASYSLHHLPRARLGTALAGLRRVLKPGGVLIVITHGGGGEEWLDRPAGRVVVSTYSMAELAAQLMGCGLVPEITSTRPARPGEYPADKIRISARLA
jgi:SAM-dependent methyltransferase